MPRSGRVSSVLRSSVSCGLCCAVRARAYTYKEERVCRVGIDYRVSTRNSRKQFYQCGFALTALCLKKTRTRLERERITTFTFTRSARVQGSAISDQDSGHHDQSPETVTRSSNLMKGGFCAAIWSAGGCDLGAALPRHDLVLAG